MAFSTVKHLEELELIDKSIMRFIIGAHAKTPSEIINLKTATILLPYVISIRKIFFFKSIVTRSEDELTIRI